MAKGKYLACLLLVLHISASYASPWLLKAGETQYITSAHFTDADSIEILKRESAMYYRVEQNIAYLNQLQIHYDNSPLLTDEAKGHRRQKIKELISNLKREQSNIRSYYPVRTVSQYIEYGITDQHNISLKIFSEMQRNFEGSSMRANGFEVGNKFEFDKEDNEILSLQPTFGMHRNYNITADGVSWGEIRVLYGRSRQRKKYNTFNSVEFAPGYSTLGTATCKLNYTHGVDFANHHMILAQTFNSFNPGEAKLYRSTSFEQLSVAKQFTIRNYTSICKLTTQVGLFKEFSLSKRKLLRSGVHFALWFNL